MMNINKALPHAPTVPAGIPLPSQSLSGINKGEPMTTQADELLVYLTINKTITQLEALSELGIMRLASRIHDLREKGHDIETKQLAVPSRRGIAFVAQYSLITKHDQQSLL